jgi:hypothetical protein
MRFALVAGILVMCVFAGLEVFLRVAGQGEPSRYVRDDNLGWALRPGIAGVNASGQRDSRHLIDKPDGVYRIAVLGDGWSEAPGLARPLAWWSRLEGLLNECMQKKGRVEVLNFAVSGYGTTQQSILLETTAMRYQPDLVLLQFNNADDVRNNSFVLEPRKDRPFYMLDARGSLRFDEAFRDQEAKAGDSRLRIVRVLFPNAYAGLADAPEAAVLAPSKDPAWQDAWRITERVIGKISAYAQRNGARLLIVTSPHPQQKPGEPGYPDKRIIVLARKLGVQAIALASQLRDFSDAKEQHAETARVVARALCVGNV